jgi:hypothetical protein
MGLRVDKKSGILLVVLSLVLTYLTPYTASAYSIAPHVLDADTLFGALLQVALSFLGRKNQACLRFSLK